MIRGTTPTHIYTLPFDVNLIDKLRIIYNQNGRTILTKSEEDCTLTENVATTRLTQKDTLAFATTALVEIQLRILTKSGDALASDVFTVMAERCLSEEVL